MSSLPASPPSDDDLRYEVQEQIEETNCIYADFRENMGLR